MYFFTGSCTFNFPRSWSSRVEAAVNCLVTDPSRNFVAGELGTSHSRLADPYPLFSTTSVPFATSTVPNESLVRRVGLNHLFHPGDILRPAAGSHQEHNRKPRTSKGHAL